MIFGTPFYCWHLLSGEFEWEYLQKITTQEIEKGNTGLMRRHAEDAFKKAFESSQGKQT